MIRRAFCAVWPVPAVAESLAAWPLPGAGRAVTADLHLTLHFLGDLDSALSVRVAEALEDLPLAPFTLTLARREFWPGPAAYVAVPVVFPAGLSDLHQLLGARLERLVPAFARRDEPPFRPHVTLGRGAPGGAIADIDCVPVDFPVAAVTLAGAAAALGTAVAGARYRRYQTTPLGAAASRELSGE